MVLRWSGGAPPQILALRDELTSRDFDEPGQWWPDYPDLVGGRDRSAGGTWCATRLSTGVTALVLNRPEKRVADGGAPSRGVLPLLAACHETDWPSLVRVAGMASFTLVLAMPDRLTIWTFDGTQLQATDHRPGTHMITSGGAEDGKADRYLSAFERGTFPDDWRTLVEHTAPEDDPAALVVQHEKDGVTFATVFAQLVEAQPGRLALQYSRSPWTSGQWQDLRLG